MRRIFTLPISVHTDSVEVPLAAGADDRRVPRVLRDPLVLTGPEGTGYGPTYVGVTVDETAEPARHAVAEA